ncbi:hypothetical protein GQR58_030260 [Nymphon striatum]|nr:hypothetical protein GQR58_030260 [Nymphon striatum]
MISYIGFHIEYPIRSYEIGTKRNSYLYRKITQLRRRGVTSLMAALLQINVSSIKTIENGRMSGQISRYALCGKSAQQGKFTSFVKEKKKKMQQLIFSKTLNIDSITVIFDRYDVKSSIKSSERLRRDGNNVVETHLIQGGRQVPNYQQFLKSGCNKSSLIKFISQHIVVNHEQLPKERSMILVGGFSDGKLVKEVYEFGISTIDLLQTINILNKICKNVNMFFKLKSNWYNKSCFGTAMTYNIMRTITVSTVNFILFITNGNVNDMKYTKYISPVLSIDSSFNPIPVKLSYIIHPPSLGLSPFSSSPICYPNCGFSGPSIVCSTGEVSGPVLLATLHCLGQIFTPCVCPHPTISLSIPPAHT